MSIQPSGQTGTAMWHNPRPQPGVERLHRPYRGIFACVELVLAGLLVWATIPMWSAGISTITMRLTNGTALTSTRYSGSWMAGAIGVGCLAALLIIDAVRQSLLAVRTRHRVPRKQRGAEA